MIITKTSTLSGIERTMDLPITEEQLKNWEDGMLIQKAMPNLTSDQREFLITGIVNEEWEELFAGYDDDTMMMTFNM
jgi:hypothetical protein